MNVGKGVATAELADASSPSSTIGSDRPEAAASVHRHTLKIHFLFPSFWNHMYLRTIVFSISLFSPIIACASEGLIFAAVYECNADEVNREMVQTCTDTYPELSPLASDAMGKWRARNSVKAKRAKDACESDLQEKAKTEAPSEIEAVRTRMADVKREIRIGFLTRLQEDGKKECTEALHQLATGTGAMDLR
jgi:hypothetical protein